MEIQRLQLWEYRNHARLDIRPGEGLNFFIGPNAQGKTNILEAVFLCAAGRSHRSPRDRELIRWGEEQSHVRLELMRREGRHVIDVRMGLQGGGLAKAININGTSLRRMGELMGCLQCVLFSPEDLRLVKEGPQERRRFMDLELSQLESAYFYRLQRYQHLLQQRNQLLKDIRQRVAAGNTLEVWDEQLAREGVALMKERSAFVVALAPLAQRAHRHVTRSAEELELSYRPGMRLRDGAEATEETMLALLREERDRDVLQGLTHTGPHRDDIVVLLNGRDTRQYASQGQQRTSALSMKLAELEYMRGRTGESPVLLLDDVMSELDPQRQNMLMDYAAQGQTLITDTDRGIADDWKGRMKEYALFRVEEGAVIRAE